MKKICRRVFVCAVMLIFVWFGTIVADKQKLRQELIRIHVVANSDSPEDQSMKLIVRDAVLNSLQSELNKVKDLENARSYLQEKLPYIEGVANQTLSMLGCEDRVNVRLQKSTFEKTTNSFLSLPSGIYESLCITIGSGEGKNWWSVLFPDVVFSEQTQDGILPVFSKSSESNMEKEVPQIRFWFLDMLGKLENNFFSG